VDIADAGGPDWLAQVQDDRVPSVGRLVHLHHDESVARAIERRLDPFD
jgi:hypothetical protein